MQRNPMSDHAPAPFSGGPDYLPSTDVRSAVPQWDSEEIHLRDYLEVLVRRKWMIICTLLLTFVTTLFLTLAQPKLYRAVSTIEVVPQDGVGIAEVAEVGLLADDVLILSAFLNACLGEGDQIAP